MSHVEVRVYKERLRVFETSPSAPREPNASEWQSLLEASVAHDYDQ
jgi:hypothetical protein